MHANGGRPKVQQPPSRSGLLGGDQAKTGQQFAIQGPEPAATGVAPGSNTGIHQRQRNAPGVGCRHGPRPELLLRPNRESRAPVVKKVADVGGRIQGQKLMDRARGEVGAKHLSR